MEYRYEIDGLRALAVFAVVFFHFDLLSLSAGFFGVDVFFVISGYLISSLLLAEIDETGSFSFSHFYLRRTRRILPALLGFLLLSYLAFVLLLGTPQSPFPDYGASLLSALFSAANIFFYLHSGYFAPDAWAQPLLHTWSLGVEEQFYLVIPVLFILASPRRVLKGKKFFLFILVLLGGISFICCRWGRPFVGGDFIFYMLPSRMWELLVGVYVALVLRKWNLDGLKYNWLYNILAFLSLSLILFVFFMFEETKYIAEKSLVVSLGTGGFILFANKNTFVGKFFSIAPLRFVGTISYSWYLWHWPMITLMAILPVRFPHLKIMYSSWFFCGLSFFIAYFSWKYIERPFRKITGWKKCIGLLVVPFFLLLIIGAGNSLSLFGTSLYTFTNPSIEGGDIRKPDATNQGHLGQHGKPEFILIGDSHARAVAPAFDLLASEYNLSGRFFQNIIVGFLEMQRANYQGNTDLRKCLIGFAKEHGIKNIFIAGRWDILWEHAQFKRLLYKYSPLPEEKIGEALKEELIAFFEALHAADCNIWVLEQVPRAKVDPTIAMRARQDYYEVFHEEPHNEILRESVKDISDFKVKLVNARDYLIKDGRMIFTAKDKLLYYDDDHLSYEGSMYVREIFRPFFEEITQPSQK